MISFEDFQKVDIRVGKVIDVKEFPEARNPSYILKIDFGDLGIKHSGAQLKLEQTKEELLGKLVLAVVNFPKKRVANFDSEVLTLGLRGTNGGWVVVSPIKDVRLGERLA